MAASGSLLERLIEDVATELLRGMGPGWPCGWPEPFLAREGFVRIEWESTGALDLDEAEAIALRILQLVEQGRATTKQVLGFR